MNVARQSPAALVIGAIGIVYGDIGTSVLYALKAVFAAGHVPPTPANIYGILSLLFWTLTIIVSFKYVTLILRADNHGEGGLIAMLALASTAIGNRPRTRAILFTIGILAAGLFYGDGVITPAISVLSAVEGLELLAPHLRAYVVPLTLAILFLLFLFQKRGTAGIAYYFGPIMLLWFLIIAVLGCIQIFNDLRILRALAPTHAAYFIWHYPGITFLMLSAIVLCVTGAEALYADMGHFGRRPIRIAWFMIVMPALVMNYFGQGALLLSTDTAQQNPFYLLAPEWAVIPLIIMATIATVIASQALISGAFSITKQVIQLGYLPRLRILHTSTEQWGQVYVPFVNWSLFVATAMAVVYFKSSDALAAAYGLAICGVMLTTTILTFFVIRYSWKLPLTLSVASTSVFLLIDIALFSSATLKIPTGGWFPLMLAVVLSGLMTSWHQGQQCLAKTRQANAVDLQPFLDAVFLAPPSRIKGTAIFLTQDPDKVPKTLLHNFKHNKVLHEHNLFVTIQTHEKPWIGLDERIEVHSLGHHCFSIILHYGFKNDPHVPEDLSAIRNYGFEFDTMQSSYFLGRTTVLAVKNSPDMRLWQKKLFIHMHRNAGAMSHYLKLPSNAVVELGSIIEI